MTALDVWMPYSVAGGWVPEHCIDIEWCSIHGDDYRLCASNHWSQCMLVERPPDRHMTICGDPRCGPCRFAEKHYRWGHLSRDELNSWPAGGDLITDVRTS